MSRADRNFTLLLLAPAALFLLIFVAYPLLILLRDSLYDVALMTPHQRVFIGFENFQRALNSSRVIDTAERTLRYTLIALTVEFILGFAMALLFNHLGRRSELLRTLFLFPLMVPPIVAGLLWRFLLIDNFGIVNHILHFLGLLSAPSDIAWLGDRDIALYSVTLPDIWLTTSFVTLVLFTGLQNIPRELNEAARIDGAGALQLFRHITLPLLRPVIAVVIIIRGIDAARAFDIIWVQTEGGPRFASEVLSMHIYRNMIRYGDVGFASAIATLFLLALLVLSLLAFFSIWRPVQWRGDS